MGREAPAPLDLDDIADVESLLLGGQGEPLLLLAVSGGIDSMALMHLCRDMVRRRKKGRILVATVDHGLRRGSDNEAAFVKREAEAIGVEHVTLDWTGEKPKSGIQAAAREARYRLLSGLYHSRCADNALLVTAHTLDDQAETVLMRLARGSGVDGLSGIPVRESFVLASSASGLRGTSDDLVRMDVVRPLLRFPKVRLEATLRALGKTWCEDPSNVNTAFERVRVRQALPVLGDLGIGAEAIATSARRLASVREALTLAVERALRDPRLVRIEPLGYAVLQKSIWSDPALRLGDEVSLRVLAAIISLVGGHPGPLSLQSLEAIARQTALAVSRGDTYGVTIGRAKIEVTTDDVTVFREARRDLPDPIALPPGARMLWDNRFYVTLGANEETGLEVRPLGPDGVKWLKALGGCPQSVPYEAMLSVPSIWDGTRPLSLMGVMEQWVGMDPKRAKSGIAIVAGPCAVASFARRAGPSTLETGF